MTEPTPYECRWLDVLDERQDGIRNSVSHPWSRRSVSSLRIEQGGVHNPEIWFSDGEVGMHRMDVDLRGYLDAHSTAVGLRDAAVASSASVSGRSR